MRTRKAKEYASRRLLHSIEICSHSLALRKSLSRYLLFVWQEARGLAKIDEDVTALHSLHCAGNNFTLLSAIFANQMHLLRLADLLHDHLLGSLRGNPAVVSLRLDREDNLFTNLSIFLNLFSIFQKNVMLRVVVVASVALDSLLFFVKNHISFINHNFYLEEFCLACGEIKLSADNLAALAVFLLIGGG